MTIKIETLNGVQIASSTYKSDIKGFCSKNELNKPLKKKMIYKINDNPKLTKSKFN